MFRDEPLLTIVWDGGRKSEKKMHMRKAFYGGMVMQMRLGIGRWAHVNVKLLFLGNPPNDFFLFCTKLTPQMINGRRLTIKQANTEPYNYGSLKIYF